MGVLKANVGGQWVPISQGWSPLAGGYVAHSILAAAVSGIGAAGTDLGVSVTWTADPTRRYKVTGVSGRIDQATAISAAFMGIYDAANTYKIGNYITMGINDFAHVTCIEVVSGLSGSTTRKLRGQTAAGSATFQAGALLLVEDITTVSPGPTQDTPWTAVTFQNSWANYGSGYQTCQYRRVGDMLQLRGVMTGGVSGSVPFTLPAGYRVPALIEVSVIGTGTAPRLALQTDGSVTCFATGPVGISSQASLTA